MQVDCPYCENEINLECEDLPNNACDDLEIEYPHCDEHLKVGWYAEAEVRQVIDGGTWKAA